MRCQREVNLVVLISNHPAYLARPRILDVGERCRSVHATRSYHPKSACRGRINDHSQFRQPTIEESLNKSYTMHPYYNNPQSRWAAGVESLYLPWAVSLDTLDGGYLGHKWPLTMTTGVFAGLTPDLNSWRYRPHQHIGGSFVNFRGGTCDRFRFSCTTVRGRRKH